MSSDALKLVVIIASAREGRFGPVVSNWFLDRVKEHGRFDIDVVDLAETPLPVALPPSFEELASVEGRSPEQVELARRLDEADAFIVVTPEYNHSYPASAKHLIDWHFTQWQAKPVGFVSYGGVSGGLRAVEHLRQVFAELHAVTVRDAVSFAMYWEQFGEDGKPASAEAPAAAKVLLDQLAWWAGALHDARAKNPYVTAG